jgi:tripartite-type tricarboxylate transporter receptor subunit TctC
MKNFVGQAARCCIAALAFCATSTVWAQAYPQRDITFVVPFAPGGSTDPIARQFVSQLEKVLPANINIENRPGGSATIGTGSVVRAAPDGYTIGLATNSALTYNPLFISGLAYKSPDDYQSIVKLGDQLTILVVRADAPWKNFEEFMADVKKTHGKIRASVSGLGTSGGLALQQFNKVAGVKITPIPFTGGGGEALVALLGGRVEASVGTVVSSKAHVEAGKLRVLAVFKKGKYDLYPDATPIADAGYDVTLTSAYYVIAPKGMPKDVQDKLAKASLQVVRSDEFLKFVKAKDYELDVKGPEAVKAELVEYSKLFSELVKHMDQK